VVHTSASTIGQVYVPFINVALFICTMLLIAGFKESTRLAGAYGIAVSATMLINTIFALAIARKVWHAPAVVIALVGAFFLLLHTVLFVANCTKIMSGGWVILVIAVAIYLLMKTWRDGRDVLRKKLDSFPISLDLLVREVGQHSLHRVPGTAVFLSGNPQGVPRSLLHNLKHNKVLHETTVILAVVTKDVPYVLPANRATIRSLGEGLFHIVLDYGFSETPHIPDALAGISQQGIHFDPADTTYFLGREALVITGQRAFAVWRKHLFYFMSHNALSATRFFHIPTNRVVELGSQIEL